MFYVCVFLQTIKQLRSFLGTVDVLFHNLLTIHLFSLLQPSWACPNNFHGHHVCMTLLFNCVLHHLMFHVFVFLQTIKQLRSFLGTVGYYRRFIPQFANHSSVLTPATVMGMPKQLSWSPCMHDSFIQLRVALSNVLCLCIPSRNLCDMPVAFHSRQLRVREKNYSASELEGLAVIEAICHFEIYLFGFQFTVVTDHKALTNLFSSTVLNAKLWRWAMYLQQFDITFRYLPGRFNVVADCLSRQTWPTTQMSSELPDVFTMSQVVSLQEESQLREKECHPQARLHQDRPLPQLGGDVGVFTPHSDPPTV